MTSEPTPHITIQFSSDAGLDWVRSGQDAIERAGEQLAKEGIDVDIDPVRSESEANAKGAVIDDILIGIATNLIARGLAHLLKIALRSLFERRRAPEAVDVGIDGETVRVTAGDARDGIESRVWRWVESRIGIGSRVTISPVD